MDYVSRDDIDLGVRCILLECLLVYAALVRAVVAGSASHEPLTFTMHALPCDQMASLHSRLGSGLGGKFVLKVIDHV